MRAESASSEPVTSLGLAGLRLRPPRARDGLAVFPLVAEVDPPLPYALLLDALSAGAVAIGEVGTGTVPSLLAHNRGDSDVLILDGEQLVGARQNRITNRSILLEAGSKTEIPVSCMEQGRWHFTTDAFAPPPKARHAPANVRRHAREAEAAVAASTGRVGRRAAAMAQGAVWNQIHAYGLKLGGTSQTGAMDEVYERRDADIESWLAAFPLEEGQVGLLAFLNGAPLGLDAIGCPELFARLHERFLGGYVMDALAAGADPGSGRERAAGPPDEADALRFLAEVSGAGRSPSEAIGKGEYRVLTGAAIGGELVDGPAGGLRLVHLSAFPAGTDRTGAVPAGPTAEARPFAPPSRRRAGKRRIE